MSSEFGLRSGKYILKILIAGGLSKKGVGISNWNHWLRGGGCNSGNRELQFFWYLKLENGMLKMVR